MNLHSLQGPAQQNQGAKVMLTEGSGQAGTRRRVDLGGVWRRGRPVLVGVDVGVLPWMSGHLGQRRTRAVKAVAGPKGPKMRRQEGIAAA
jgi:hypothetical protein